MKRYLLVQLALLAGLPAADVHAAVHCVDTAAELLAAANADFDAGEVQDVRIVQGTYSLSQPIVTAFTVGHLQLRGGYLPGCNARATDPYNTVLDFTAAGVQGAINTAGAQKITVTWLTVQDAAYLYLYGVNETFSGPGVDVHNAVLRRIGPNPAIIQDAPIRITGQSSVDFRNNLVHDLLSSKAGCGIAFTHDGSSTTIVNNTFGNMAKVGNIQADVCFDTPAASDDPGLAFAYNNIVWSQPLQSGFWNEGVSMTSVNNTVAYFIGDPPSFQSGTLTGNPLFVNPGAGDYHLPNNSNSVNSGVTFVPGGLSDVDLVNDPRHVGSAPDRGAYESTFDDTTTMLVTNTNDSGAGSLRQALITANGSPGAKQVTFQIPGNCPHTIVLQTPLPDIQVPVHLRGRTQAGSTPNASELGFDANICIVLHNGSAASRALRVAIGASNARLRVEGIGFSNFSDRAIALEGGHDHVVAGSQFGGTMPTTPLVQNGSHLVVGAGVQHYTIGGSGAASRNLFANSNVNFIASHGILIEAGADGGIVTNNLIGMQRGLGSKAPNRIGLRVDADNTEVTGNLIAGNTGDGLAINGDNSIVQGNTIGFQNLAGTFGNGGAGVSLAGDADLNSVGSLSLTGNPVADGNHIAYNLSGGIHVRDSAGVGNLLRGNRIYGHANRPQIDLGNPGQDVNDAGDGDTGPNTRLNHPVVTGVTLLAPVAPNATNVPAQVAGTLQTASGSYVVDVYGGSFCSKSIGDARDWLGSVIVTVPNGGSMNFALGVTLPKVTGYSVTATTTNNIGSTSETSVCFAVPPPNQPPTVANAIPDQTSAEGQSVNLDLSNVFADADGDPLTLVLSAGSLPPGLGFDGSTISGVPTYAAAAVYNGLTITASDGKGGSVSDTFVWTVLNTNQAPTFVGEPYAFTATKGQPSTAIGSVQATDADPGSLLQYSITSGNGGGVFAIDAGTGQISAPVTSALVVGVSTFTVTASDGAAIDTASVQVTIGSPVVPPDLVFRDGFE